MIKKVLKKVRCAAIFFMMMAPAVTCLSAEVAVNEKGILTIGYVKIGAESDWRLACNKSLTDTFTTENGYYLLTSDAQQKQEKQVKAIREFISQEVDYILLDPITETGWDGSLEEAKEAGIPVIVFDREVNVEADDAYTAWVGSDFLLEGRRACAWLEAYLDSLQWTEPVNIVHIQGTEDSSAQLGRTAALDEALARNSSWVLLDRQNGEFTTAKGKEVMVDFLEQFPDEIQIVYCENDNEAYGAIDAIHEAGRIAGTDLAAGEILVLSFDATGDGLNMTLDGQIAVNTECAPLYGPVLSQLIAQLEKGETPDFRQCVTEEQFSCIEEPSQVEVEGQTYAVTMLTEEMIEGRTY